MTNLLTASASAASPTRFIQPEQLTAADADTPRELSGLVLPFGVPGRTSRGTLSVTASAVKLPTDLKRIKLYRDHSDAAGSPVGYATAAEVREDGIYMSFRVAATPDGDAALADVNEGVRDALSVELVAPQISGSQITAANLTAVALVAVPAFDDARVTTPPATQAAPSLAARLSTSMVTAAAATDDKLTLSAAAATIAAAASGTRDDTVTAALGELTDAGNPDVSDADWLGEAWSGAPYERLIVPTLASKPLTRSTLRGWRWKVRPEVGTYEGNLAEIPTNSPSTEAVEVEATRIAGGHKLDRKYVDFPDAEFMASYMREMAGSYAEKSDLAAAKFVTGEVLKTWKKANDQSDLLRAAGKARQLIKRTLRVEPTTYLVNPDDLFKLMDVTVMDQPQYLKLLGVDPEKFIDDENVPAGHVLAYHEHAFLCGELAGSPIRVNALDVARGGSDEALFGYLALLTQDVRGMAGVKFSKVVA